MSKKLQAGLRLQCSREGDICASIKISWIPNSCLQKKKKNWIPGWNVICVTLQSTLPPLRSLPCPVLQPCLSSHTDASVLALERAFQPAVRRPPAKGYLLTQRDAEKHQRLARHGPELGRCERLSAKEFDICGQETLQKQAGVKGLKTSDLLYAVFHHVNVTRSPIPLFNFFHVWWLKCDLNATG